MDPELELTELRERVAHLEALVARAVADPPAVRREPAPPASTGVDRRRMLRNGLGLSAVAVAGVVALDAVGSSAAAADGDPVLVSQTVSPSSAASAPTTISNPSTTAHATALLRLDNVTDQPVDLPANTKAALLGVFGGHEAPPVNGVGVLGLSDFGVGVQGQSQGTTGVLGTSTFGVGVSAVSGSGTGVGATSGSGTAVSATSTSGKGLVATSDTGEAVHATSTSNIGVVGNGPFGVVGNGSGGSGVGVGATGNVGVKAQGVEAAVDATAVSGVAVEATSTIGNAVQATAGGIAVLANSTGGPGVKATSAQDCGVWGEVDNPEMAGVVGVNNSGSAVVGFSHTGAGLSGNSKSGPGARATSESGVAFLAAATSAPAVSATSQTATGLSATSATAVGAVLKGGAAAVRLVPQSKAGHPTSGHHDRGELLVDSTGKLWLCTKAGTPGTWKQLAFV